MSWASRRRFFILLGIGAVGVAFLAAVLISTFYKAPSCSDGVQNQGEVGIDCGGPCSYLCTVQAHAPTVLYTKALSRADGGADVVALIENANATAAAKDVPYSIVLYDDHKVLLQQVNGTVDLPPATKVPVYAFNIPTGKHAVASAFLTIDSAAPRWYTVQGDPRVKPVVSNITLGGTSDAPRVDSLLTNGSLTTLSNIQTIVIVHDDQGEVIAASQTIVPVVPAQGEAAAIFTWNAPFLSTPATVEVLPVVPLP